jgi:hypothetical protein
MPDLSKASRDTLAKFIAGGKSAAEQPDIYASCQKADADALVTKVAGIMDDLVVRAGTRLKAIIGERNAALSRASAAEDLSLSQTSFSPQERSMVNVALKAAERECVAAGWHPDQLKAFTEMFRKDDLPSDVGMSMDAGTTEPLALRALQFLATNKPKDGPPLGRAFYAVPNPVDTAASQSGMPSKERREYMVDVAMKRKEYVPVR